jgi:hypothetical protein
MRICIDTCCQGCRLLDTCHQGFGYASTLATKVADMHRYLLPRLRICIDTCYQGCGYASTLATRVADMHRHLLSGLRICIDTCYQGRGYASTLFTRVADMLLGRMKRICLRPPSASATWTLSGNAGPPESRKAGWLQPVRHFLVAARDADMHRHLLSRVADMY